MCGEHRTTGPSAARATTTCTATTGAASSAGVTTPTTTARHAHACLPRGTQYRRADAGEHGPAAQAGDKLLVFTASAVLPPSTPSGWTRDLLVSGTLGTVHLALFTRTAAGGDSFVFPALFTGCYHAYAEVPGVPAIDQWGTWQSNTAGSVTPTADSDLVLHAFAGLSLLGVPLVGTLVTQITVGLVRLQTAYSTAGTAGTPTATNSASGALVSATVALK